MNYLRSFAFNTFLSTLLLQAMPSLAGEESKAETNAGRISFVFDDKISLCGVNATEQMFEISYYAGGGPGVRPCPVSKIRYIKLDGVRSAATIRLWSYLRSGRPGGCHPTYAHNFTMYLRTVNAQTSTALIDLSTLKDQPLNTPIQPGVVLKRKEISNPDKIDHNLSCVEVIYD
ncbi:hypothetical protein J2W17_002195 [Pseudomonas lini]|uniref:hypothetical protein n=1 Tax=Pseudomonas lini TaxID=163011 RepID=UPI002782643D|nr:hypothetical protein [Pseudomonas lini]MDQ0123248.1 hypothetical protein [Pseudomonas lini]